MRIMGLPRSTYVDLNPIRAGLAETPENSDFTSIQLRIRDWQKNNRSAAADQPFPNIQPEINPRVDLWLCPITSTPQRRGILDISGIQYFDLLGQSGCIIRQDKRGFIPANLAPILSRIGARPEAWIDTISRFGSKFHLAAGKLINLRNFAKKIGVQWLSGLSTARASFS
jgi:putative transposase